MNLSAPSTILITCARGLVDHLKLEIEGLGYSALSVHRTSLTIEGTMADCMKLNLQLRTAFSVLYLLREFSCNDGDELYEQTVKIAWEDLISPDEYLTVTSRVDTPSLNNSMFPSLKVKDAIVDRIANMVICIAASDS